MMITLMNSIAVLLGLALLFAFVWGAWRHTLEQILDDPLLADPTPAAKTKQNFTLVGKVLWNIVVLVVMVGGMSWSFCSLWAKKRVINLKLDEIPMVVSGIGQVEVGIAIVQTQATQDLGTEIVLKRFLKSLFSF